MSKLSVLEARKRRHRRVRGKIVGTAERPRLSVFRSNLGISAQLIDDSAGKTVAAASWLQLKKSFQGTKTEQAAEVGKALAANAKKNLFTVPKHGTTITHEILGAHDAARVLLRPASPGTGVIAGGGVRAVLELAGIRDILAKSLGTTNPINMLKATVNGLQRLRRPDEVAATRGLTISQVLPVGTKERQAAQPLVRESGPGGGGGPGGVPSGEETLPEGTSDGEAEDHADA